VTAAPIEDDFFAELEKEIKEVTAKSKLKADAAALKKQANNTRLAAWQRKQAAADFASLQAIIDATAWRPTAIGALFTEQHCDGCDTVHHTFLQYMLQEEKISNPSTRRWIRLLVPADGSLPRQTIVQPIKTHMCASCAPEHGFDVDAPTFRLLPSLGNLTVSSTYVQGDINGTPQEG
jgi:hypothetical protein